MNFAGFRRKSIRTMMVLSVSILIFSTTTAHADELPEPVKQAVQNKYPGAVVTESRKELWQGEMMHEIEIETIDGRQLELIVSGHGRIMKTGEEKGLPVIGGDLSIGVGVMMESDIYRGVGSEIGPVFFVRYEVGDLEILAFDSLDMDYTFFRKDHLAVAVKGAVFFNAGYDADDSSYLNGMDKLETLYSAGLAAQWNVSGWEIGLEVMQDISGEHDGREIELSVSKTWTAGSYALTPSLSLAWMSSRMTDYFYGVSVMEARADRRAYSPGSSYEAELELMVQRHLFGNFTGIGVAGISTFGSDIKDSPLVDEDYAAQLILGIMYTF